MGTVFDMVSASAQSAIWLKVFVDVALKSSLLVAAVGLLALLLRRYSASSRSLVWALGLGGLVLLPVLSLFVPAWHVPLLPDIFCPPMVGEAHIPSVEIEDDMAVGQQTARSGSAPVSEPGWSFWTASIWGIGALLVLAWMLVAKAGVWWIRRHSQPLTDESWLSLLRGLSGELGIGREVMLLESRLAAVAITCGVRRPEVILPDCAADWAQERRRIVLLHELAHIKRGDSLTELLALLVSVVYWFNPLVWLAVRQHKRERERACDDAVLTFGTRPSEYAFHLMEIATDLSAARSTLLQAAAISQGSSLKDRLLCILNPRIKRGVLKPVVAVLACLLVAALVLPLAAFQPWSQNESAKGEWKKAKVGGYLADLTAKLDYDHPLKRAGAAYRLGLLGPRAAAAVPALIDLLGDNRQVDRLEIGYGADSIGHGSASRMTSPGLEAANALIEIGDEAVEPLLAALARGDELVRMHAVLALGKIGGLRAEEAVMGALEDESEYVRRKAAIVLGLGGTD